MERPSLDPDSYIHAGRFSAIVAGALLAGGLALIWIGIDPSEPLWRELSSQIGVALLTTALIDLVLLRGIDAWKRSLASPFTNLAKRMHRFDDALDRVLADTEELVTSTSEQVHRQQVEMELALIKLDLEAIHRAVDPSYRQICEALEQKDHVDGSAPNSELERAD